MLKIGSVYKSKRRVTIYNQYNLTNSEKEIVGIGVQQKLLQPMSFVTIIDYNSELGFCFKPPITKPYYKVLYNNKTFIYSIDLLEPKTIEYDWEFVC